MKSIISLFLFFICLSVSAQTWVPSPGKAQSQKIYLMNGTVHIGNGKVIENGVVGFENGKITLVADATTIRLDASDAKTIDVSGKHIYPGLISPNSLNGLVEINAVRASRDYQEVGDFNPHIRSLIAYNTDSWVTPTVRSNGIMLAQVRPTGGRISGSSSVMQLDAWNWEDAAVLADDGIFVKWPSVVNKGGWWGEPEPAKPNKKYDEELHKLKTFMKEALAYSKTSDHKTKNLRFEAMRRIWSGKQNLYVTANHAKEMMAAIEFLKKEMNIEKVVLLGGRDSWLVADLLVENNVPLILQKTHSLPFRDDDDIDFYFRLPAMLQEKGVQYCLMAENFSGEQRNLPFFAGKAAAYGLNKEEALAAITKNAAEILGIGDSYGTLEQGKSATIIVSEGDVLDPISNHITDAYIDGRKLNLENKQKELYRKFMEKYEKTPKQH